METRAVMANCDVVHAHANCADPCRYWEIQDKVLAAPDFSHSSVGFRETYVNSATGWFWAGLRPIRLPQAAISSSTR